MKKALLCIFCLSMIPFHGASTSAFADEKVAQEKVEKAAPSQAPKKAEKVFTGEAAEVKREMEALFDASQKVNGAEKAAAREKIETALDWDRVAKDCLGPVQWKKQPEKNKEEFRATLKEVIVKTAYSRMDKFWDNTTYQFSRIDVKGNAAHVTTKFNAAGDHIVLDYYLDRKGSKWFIHDISFEDLRYSENISEQITAFLKEKPFSQLIASLKKRRDELTTPTTKDKS